MRRLLLCLAPVLAVVVCLSVYLTVRPAAHAASPAKTAWSEKTMGSIPKAWGDLVGVTNVNMATTLVFKDAKGMLRRVQWNANGGVTTLVHVLDRAY